MVKPTLVDIQLAAQRLADVVQETPLLHFRTDAEMAGGPLWMKLENMQRTGSFKIRGAYNLISQLSESDRTRGVIAASAGNHAQGVAFAASKHNAPCTIVMPEGASLAKISATQAYGAKVVLHGDTYDDAYQLARELQATQGYVYVHAFDDPLIIAGQGTVGLEILRQLPTLQTIVVPMGGGGLVTGIALAVKTQRPDVRIYGVEAAAAACFRHSFDVGRLEAVSSVATIADGIAVKRPGELTYALAKDLVDDVLTVEDEEIVRAMVVLMERSKLVTEGAAAAAFAAATSGKLPADAGPTVVVLSGGNVDLSLLSRMIEHGYVQAGRFLRLTVTLVDKPGALRNLLQIIADLRANVVSIQHHRIGHKISLGETEVEIDLETRDDDHIVTVMRAIETHGYRPVQRD